MNKADYPIVVHALSEEDGGGFLATVPDFAGCMSDGETYDEAIASVLAAMDEWTDEMSRLGRSIPEPYSLAGVVADEKAKLRDLIRAQAELIEKHEQALDQQNASLNQLRDQIKVLSSRVEVKGVVVSHAMDTGADRCSQLWVRDVCLVQGSAAIPHALVARKAQLQH